MNYNNKKVVVSVIYRFPSQNNNNFDSFLFYFEQLLRDINNGKPSLSVIATGICN